MTLQFQLLHTHIHPLPHNLQHFHSLNSINWLEVILYLMVGACFKSWSQYLCSLYFLEAMFFMILVALKIYHIYLSFIIRLLDLCSLCSFPFALAIKFLHNAIKTLLTMLLVDPLSFKLNYTSLHTSFF